MKSDDKIKLQSDAATLFDKIANTTNGFVKLPLVESLALIIMQLTEAIISYIRPVFERTKTIKEFERKAKGLLASVCNFVSGVNVEAVNDAGQAIVDVDSRFDMGKPLSFFGSPSRAPHKATIRGSVLAHYCGPFTPGQKKFYPDLDQVNISTKAFKRKSKEEQDRHFAHYRKPHEVEKFKRNARMAIARSWMKDPDKEVLKRIIDTRDNAAFTMNNTFDSSSELEMPFSTMYHELGHRFHAHLSANDLDPTFMNAVTETYNTGWAYALSKYAAKNEMEYFAESFCAYMLASFEPKYYAMINPQMLKFFRKYDKKDISKELTS